MFWLQASQRSDSRDLSLPLRQTGLLRPAIFLRTKYVYINYNPLVAKIVSNNQNRKLAQKVKNTFISHAPLVVVDNKITCTVCIESSKRVETPYGILLDIDTGRTCRGN